MVRTDRREYLVCRNRSLTIRLHGVIDWDDLIQ